MRFSEAAYMLGRELLKYHREVCWPVHTQAERLTSGDVRRLCLRYGSLCDRAGAPYLTRNAGAYLHEIAVWCDAQGWPPINALVVNETGLPGGTVGTGYDAAPGGGFAVWPEQVRRAIVFRGYPELMPEG